MTLPAPLLQTCVAVGTALAEARDPWWIISGAAAALLGAEPIIVADVDVLLSVHDAEALFLRLEIERAPPSDHPRFRSAVFGRWTEPPLTAEFMADFAVRDLDGDWRPVRPVTRRQIELGVAAVFVPAAQELRAMFQRFGREKDLQRLVLLDRLASAGPGGA